VTCEQGKQNTTAEKKQDISSISKSSRKKEGLCYQCDARKSDKGKLVHCCKCNKKFCTECVNTSKYVESMKTSLLFHCDTCEEIVVKQDKNLLFKVDLIDLGNDDKI